MAPVASTRPATSSFLLVLVLQSILLGLLSPSVSAEPQQVMLETGALNVNHSLENTARQYRLIMLAHCDLLLLEGETHRLWESDTTGEGTDCVAKFLRKGKDVSLVIYSNHENTVIWREPNTSPEKKYVLVLQPDRHVVIYSESTWSTKTNLENSTHQYGDQALIDTGTLEDGGYLIDSQHNYRFILKDCNLFLYDGNFFIWQSGVQYAAPPCRAFLNNSGNLVIRDSRDTEVWSSDNQIIDNNHALVLQPDRNLVVYNKPVWRIGRPISKRAANLMSDNEEDGGLPAGRKTMIHMVTNKQAP